MFRAIGTRYCATSDGDEFEAGESEFDFLYLPDDTIVFVPDGVTYARVPGG